MPWKLLPERAREDNDLAGHVAIRAAECFRALAIAAVLPDGCRPLPPSRAKKRGRIPPRRQGCPSATGTAPPRSSALAKPRLCRPGAPPCQSSLTALPPCYLRAFAPFRRKTLFAFRVRGIPSQGRLGTDKAISPTLMDIYVHNS